MASLYITSNSTSTPRSTCSLGKVRDVVSVRASCFVKLYLINESHSLHRSGDVASLPRTTTILISSRVLLVHLLLIYIHVHASVAHATYDKTRGNFTFPSAFTSYCTLIVGG